MDPEAEAALQAAGEAVNELEMRAAVNDQKIQVQDGLLGEANTYIKQLETAVQNKDKELESKILIEMIRADSKLDVEALKIGGNLTEQQLTIISEAETAKKDRLAKFLELQSQQPVTGLDLPVDETPSYNSVHEVRGRGPLAFMNGDK